MSRSCGVRSCDRPADVAMIDADGEATPLCADHAAAFVAGEVARGDP